MAFADVALGNSVRSPFAVTIDFHDTLFSCDQWFALEVEQLIPAFLDWLARERRLTFDTSLVETGRVAYRRLRREIIADGIELDAGACVDRILGELGLSIAAEEIAGGVEHLMRGALPTARPMPGAVELVRELRASGARLAVISNAIYQPFLEWSLASFGLDSDFDAVVSSARAGYYKSRPEIYRHTLATLGVPARRAVHIGDSLRFDVEGAGAAGMRTVWLDRSGDGAGDGRADLTVTSLQGLAATVLALLERAEADGRRAF